MGKRCDKGKSCGATCIERLDICQLDLSQSEGIEKVRGILHGKDPKLSPLESPEDFINLLEGKVSGDTGGGRYSYEKAAKNVSSASNTDVRSAIKEYTSSYLTTYEIRKVQSGEMEKSDYDRKMSDRKPYLREIRKLAERIKELKKKDPNSLELERLSKELKLYQSLLKNYPPPTRLDKERHERMKERRSKLKMWGEAMERLLSNPAVSDSKIGIAKYRGIRVDDDVLKDMKQLVGKGSVMPVNSLSSWSASLGTAKNFADREAANPGKGNAVIFRAINKNGIPLGDLSHAKMESADTEMEILTSGRGKLRYTGYRPITVYIPKQGTFTYHVFDVEEL